MSDQRMRIVVTSLLVVLTSGLSARSGDLLYPEGGTEIARQLARSREARSRRSPASDRPARRQTTGTPAPFPEDPPPQRSAPSRAEFFTTRSAAASQPRLDTPDWISRSVPLISQTGFSTPAAAETIPATTRPRQSSDSAADADGTWREDGGFIIINLGGRQLKLRKEGAPVRQTSSFVPSGRTTATSPFSEPSPAGTTLRTADRPPQSKAEDLSRFVGSRGGSAVGRLLNHGRPLVNCQVALIPIEKATFGGYDIDGKSKPQTAKTDETGNYRFDHIPAGLYKLFWLPKGTRRWIRRIQFEPDAVVRSGETVEVKTVRVATRTVN